MPQYEVNVSSVIDSIIGSNLDPFIRGAAVNILGSLGRDNIKIGSITSQDKPTNVDFAVVEKSTTLDYDPNAPIIVAVSGSTINAQFDASHDRVVVGSDGADRIVFKEGTGNVSVESGGGNDYIKTSGGSDLISITGQGNVTVESGSGDDVIFIQNAVDHATVDGGLGYDVIKLDGSASSHTIVYQDGHYVIDGKIVVSGVEAVKFSDITVNLSQQQAQSAPDQPMDDHHHDDGSNIIPDDPFAVT